MRVYKNSDGTIRIDNSLTAIDINYIDRLTFRQGYEPLGAFEVSEGVVTINGIPFEINNPQKFSFGVELPENVVPNQDKLKAIRRFVSSFMKVEEEVTLERGIRGARVQYNFTARQPGTTIDSYRVGVNFLDADEYRVTNPNGYVGIPNTVVGLWIPGIDRPFYAHEMLQEARNQGLEGEQAEKWINQQINEAIRKTGTDYIAFFGWDKFVIMYSPKGIENLVIKYGDTDLDEDNIVEWTSAQFEFTANKTLGPGETFTGKPVYFSHSFATLSLVDKNGLPVERYLVTEWIRRRKEGIRDGMALDSNYAYPLPALTLGQTSDFYRELAEQETDPEKKSEYQRLAQEYGDAALKAAVFAKKVFDTSFGRKEFVPPYGIMRFYGYHAALYEWAYRYIQREGNAAYERLINSSPENSEQRKWYESLIEEGHFPKEVQENWRISCEKLASSAHNLGEEEREDIYIGMSKTEYENSWRGEVYRIADAIVALQELRKDLPNYGGFKQNEGPSVAQLDDNGAKLWALRIAYDLAMEENNLLHSIDSTVRMKRYRKAAERNINNWIKVDENGQFWGWRDPLRPESLDEQRTTYGQVNMLVGLAAWADTIPKARELFDLGIKHFQERHNYVHNVGLGPNMYHSDKPINSDVPDGRDNNTENTPILVRAALSWLRANNIQPKTLNESKQITGEKQNVGILKWLRHISSKSLWYNIGIAIAGFFSYQILSRIFKKEKEKQLKEQAKEYSAGGLDLEKDKKGINDIIEGDKYKKEIDKLRSHVRKWISKHISSSPRDVWSFFSKASLIIGAIICAGFIIFGIFGVITAVTFEVMLSFLVIAAFYAIVVIVSFVIHKFVVPFKEQSYTTTGEHERFGVMYLRIKIKLLTKRIENKVGIPKLIRKARDLERGIGVLKKDLAKMITTKREESEEVQNLMKQISEKEQELEKLRKHIRKLRQYIQDNVVGQITEELDNMQIDNTLLTDMQARAQKNKKEIDRKQSKFLNELRKECFSKDWKRRISYIRSFVDERIQDETVAVPIRDAISEIEKLIEELKNRENITFEDIQGIEGKIANLEKLLTQLSELEKLIIDTGKKEEITLKDIGAILEKINTIEIQFKNFKYILDSSRTINEIKSKFENLKNKATITNEDIVYIQNLSESGIIMKAKAPQFKCGPSRKNKELVKNMKLSRRNSQYLEKRSQSEGIIAAIQRTKEGIIEDTRGRLLPDGLLPNTKTRIYTVGVRILQFLFALGTAFLAFNIAIWLAIPIFAATFFVTWPVADKIINWSMGENLIPLIAIFGILSLVSVFIIGFSWVFFILATCFFVTCLLGLRLATEGPKDSPMLSITELKEFVDEYAQKNGIPYTVAIEIPIYSGDEKDVEEKFNFLTETIENLTPTLNLLGENFRVVFVIPSNTNTGGQPEKGNRIAEYERQKVAEFKERYKDRGISFIYLRRNSGWFVKPGNVINCAQFLCEGITTQELYTDPVEHGGNIQKKGQPIYDKVEGDFLSLFSSPDKPLKIKRKDGSIYTPTSDDEVKKAILNGEQLIFDEIFTPELHWIMDDKNTLMPGTLEKSLRFMLHPDNAHVMIGTPYIDAVQPKDLEGKEPVSSVWMDIMEIDRKRHNESSVRTEFQIFGAEVFYGKGIIRTRDWYRIVGKAEALPPNFSLSHDWQESVLTWAEGMFGSKKFQIVKHEISETEMILEVHRGHKVELFKIIAQDKNIIMYEFKDEIFVETRKFSGVLENQNLEQAIEKDIKPYLKDDVHITERDLLSYLSRFLRDGRWLAGDKHMIGQIGAYKDCLPPRHQLHLSKIRRRFTGDASFGLYIALMTIGGLAGIINMINPLLGLALTLLSVGSLITIDRLLIPIQFARQQLNEVRTSGERNLFKLIKSYFIIFYKTLNMGIGATLYSTFVALGNIVSNTLAGIRTLLANRIGEQPGWGGALGNAALSLFERKTGFPLFEDTKDGNKTIESYRTRFKGAFKTGWVITGIIGILGFIGFILTRTVPVGIGINLTSFLTGVLAMYLSAIPEKKMFQHYPVLFIGVILFGSLVLVPLLGIPAGLPAFSFILYLLFASFYIAEISNSIVPLSKMKQKKENKTTGDKIIIFAGNVSVKLSGIKGVGFILSGIWSVICGVIGFAYAMLYIIVVPLLEGIIGLIVKAIIEEFKKTHEHKNLKKSEVSQKEVDSAIERAILNGQAIGLDVSSELDIDAIFGGTPDQIAIALTSALHYNSDDARVNAQNQLAQYFARSDVNIPLLKERIKLAYQMAKKAHQPELLTPRKDKPKHSISKLRLVILLTDDDVFATGKALAHTGLKEQSIYIHIDTLRNIETDDEKTALQSILEHEYADMIYGSHDKDIKESEWQKVKKLWDKLLYRTAIKTGDIQKIFDFFCEITKLKDLEKIRGGAAWQLPDGSYMDQFSHVKEVVTALQMIAVGNLQYFNERINPEDKEKGKEFNPETFGQVREIYQELISNPDDREILQVFVVLHDYGKLWGEDHYENGAREIEPLLKGLGLSQNKIEFIKMLILRHSDFGELYMGESVPQEIIDFLNKSGLTPQQIDKFLKMQLILHVCDVNAVGPGRLTANQLEQFFGYRSFANLRKLQENWTRIRLPLLMGIEVPAIDVGTMNESQIQNAIEQLYQREDLSLVWNAYLQIPQEDRNKFFDNFLRNMKFRKIAFLTRGLAQKDPVCIIKFLYLLSIAINEISQKTGTPIDFIWFTSDKEAEKIINAIGSMELSEIRQLTISEDMKNIKVIGKDKQGKNIIATFPIELQNENRTLKVEPEKIDIINVIEGANQLKQKAERLAEYFVGGVGAKILAIEGYVMMIQTLQPGEDIKTYLQGIEKLISGLENLYNQSPFSELGEATKNEELKPLVEVKKLIPELRREFNNLESDPEDASERILLICEHISNLGGLFEAYIRHLIYRIRQFSGEEKFNVRITKHISGEKIDRTIAPEKTIAIDEKQLEEAKSKTDASRQKLKVNDVVKPLLDTLGISNLEKNSNFVCTNTEKYEEKYVIKTYEYFPPSIAKSASEIPRGFEIVRNELGNYEKYEFLYDENGRLLAVFPSKEEVNSKKNYEIRYLVLWDYYFGWFGSIDNQNVKQSLEEFYQNREHFRRFLDSYIKSRFNNTNKLIPLGEDELQDTIAYLEFDLENGIWFATHSKDNILRRVSLPPKPNIKRLIIPIYPTVYSPSQEGHYSYDQGYYEYLLKYLQKGEEVLVVGPGSGSDCWVAAQITGRKVYAIGINPLEIVNSKVTARIARFELEGYVADNIVDNNVPVIKGKKFRKIIWNMPNYYPEEEAELYGVKKSLRDWWDEDIGGQSFIRFMSGLQGVLSPDGSALIWNNGLPPELLRSFTGKLKIEKLGENIYKISLVNNSGTGKVIVGPTEQTRLDRTHPANSILGPLNLNSNDIYLDLAGGPGTYTAVASKIVKRVIYLDISKLNLPLLKGLLRKLKYIDLNELRSKQGVDILSLLERFPDKQFKPAAIPQNVSIIQGDAARIPLEDNSVTKISVTELFTWLERQGGPDKVESCIREMLRVTKPGGLIHIVYDFPARVAEFRRELERISKEAGVNIEITETKLEDNTLGLLVKIVSKKPDKNYPTQPKSLDGSRTNMRSSPVSLDEVIRRFIKEKKKLPKIIAFDLDGTLIPLGRYSGKVDMSNETMGLLRELSKYAKIAIITGASFETVKGVIGDLSCISYVFTGRGAKLYENQKGQFKEVYSEKFSDEELQKLEQIFREIFREKGVTGKIISGTERITIEIETDEDKYELARAIRDSLVTNRLNFAIGVDQSLNRIYVYKTDKDSAIYQLIKRVLPAKNILYIGDEFEEFGSDFGVLRVPDLIVGKITKPKESPAEINKFLEQLIKLYETKGVVSVVTQVGKQVSQLANPAKIARRAAMDASFPENWRWLKENVPSLFGKTIFFISEEFDDNQLRERLIETTETGMNAIGICLIEDVTRDVTGKEKIGEIQVPVKDGRYGLTEIYRETITSPATDKNAVILYLKTQPGVDRKLLLGRGALSVIKDLTEGKTGADNKKSILGIPLGNNSGLPFDSIEPAIVHIVGELSIFAHPQTVGDELRDDVLLNSLVYSLTPADISSEDSKLLFQKAGEDLVLVEDDMVNKPLKDWIKEIWLPAYNLKLALAGEPSKSERKYGITSGKTNLISKITMSPYLANIYKTNLQPAGVNGLILTAESSVLEYNEGIQIVIDERNRKDFNNFVRENKGWLDVFAKYTYAVAKGITDISSITPEIMGTHLTKYNYLQYLRHSQYRDMIKELHNNGCAVILELPLDDLIQKTQNPSAVISYIEYLLKLGFDGVQLNGISNLYQVPGKDVADSLLRQIVTRLHSINPEVVLLADSVDENVSNYIRKTYGISTAHIVRDASQDIRVTEKSLLQINFDEISQQENARDLVEKVLTSGAEGIILNIGSLLANESPDKFSMFDLIERIGKIVSNKYPKTESGFYQKGYDVGSRIKISKAKLLDQIFVGLQKMQQFILRYNEGRNILYTINAPGLHSLLVAYQYIKSAGENGKLSLQHHSIQGDFFTKVKDVLTQAGLTENVVPEVWTYINQLQRKASALTDIEEKTKVNIQLIGFIQGFLENMLYQQYVVKTKHEVPLEYRETFKKLLVLADSFVVRDEDGSVKILAGYGLLDQSRIFQDRDTFTGITGILVATGRYEEAKKVLNYYANKLKESIPADDSSLWFIESLYRYYQATGDVEFAKKMVPVVNKIIDFWNQYLGRDKLIMVPAQWTWMDSPDTPRNGKPVEIQALFYNALKITAEFNRLVGNKKKSKELTQQAQEIKTAINTKFFDVAAGLQSRNYPYDVLDSTLEKDAAVRPNAVFLLSLSHVDDLLLPNIKVSIIEKIESELLTPFGLRILSPQGTIYPWLISHYIFAKIKLMGNLSKEEVLQEVKNRINNLVYIIREKGTLPELFTGEAPYIAGGAFSQVRSVAAMLEIFDWFVKNEFKPSAPVGQQKELNISIKELRELLGAG